MNQTQRPRISVESSDPLFRAYSLIALESFGEFVVAFSDPSRGDSASSPPADLLLLDRRYRPFAPEWTSGDSSPRPRSSELPIVIVTDLPDVPEIVHEFGTGRPVHVLRDSADPRDLCEEVTRIWELHRSAHRFN